MALRGCWSFDDPVPLKNWAELAGNSIVAGRNGNCLKINGTGVQCRIDLVAGTTNHLLMGYACRLASAGTGSYSDPNFDPGLISLSATQPGSFHDVDGVQISLTVRGDGTIDLHLGGPTQTTIASSAIGVIDTNGGVFNYLEIDALIANAGGQVIVKVDGFEVINYTGDTQGYSTDQIASVYFGSVSAAGSAVGHYIDDLYLADTTGTTNNTLLGDIRVDVILPSGNGTRSEMAGSDGNSVDNYLLVDDPTADTADYVSSDTVGVGDLYQFADVSAGRGVLAAQVVAYAQKSLSGTRAVRAIASDGTTTVNGADSPLQTAWAPTQTPFDLAPDGAAWSVTKINAAQFGVEVSV